MKKFLFFSLYFIIAMISSADWQDEMDDIFASDIEDFPYTSANSDDDEFSENKAAFSQPEIAVEPAEAPSQIHTEPPEIEQALIEQYVSEAVMEENQIKPPPPPETPRAREPPRPPVRTVVPAVTNVPPAASSLPVYERPQNPVPPPSSARPQTPVPPAPQTGAVCIYRIQLGAFSRLDNAQNCYSRLQSAGFSPLYEQYGSLWRVIIIGVKTADMARIIMRLQTAGFTDVWIREEK